MVKQPFSDTKSRSTFRFEKRLSTLKYNPTGQHKPPKRLNPIISLFERSQANQNTFSLFSRCATIAIHVASMLSRILDRKSIASPTSHSPLHGSAAKCHNNSCDNSYLFRKQQCLDIAKLPANRPPHVRQLIYCPNPSRKTQ